MRKGRSAVSDRTVDFAFRPVEGKFSQKDNMQRGISAQYFEAAMRLSKKVAERSHVEGRPPLIAVVEDDASMLRSIQRLLAIQGFDVEAHRSAEAFLDRHSTSPVDCVVLDIQLPK